MAEDCYTCEMAITRKKTTVYLDPELLQAVKVVAERNGRHDYEILEDAVRLYLGTAQAETSRQALRELLDLQATQASVGDDEALDLAYAELHAARRARRQD